MVRWGVNVAPGEALNLRIAGQASQTRIRLIRPDGTVRVKDATLITEGPPRNVSVLDAGSAPGQWRLEVLYANAPYRLNKLDGSDRGIYLTWVTGGGTTDGTFNVSVTDAGGTPASKPIKLTLTNNTTGEVYSGVSTGEVPLPEGFFFPLAGFSGQFPAGSYTVTASVPEGQTGYTVRPASVNVDLWCRKLVPLAFTIDYLTTTTVGSGPSPSVYGQGVTIAATVAGPPSAGIPQGTVTFLDGATTLGVVNLNGAGQAALTTWGLWAG
ncbi:MAG: Ig-like domain-containing protein, partial [Acidobacteria bacterium]|nr:Ig-like domain-containing protein [Acidobacteriota bacterium]